MCEKNECGNDFFGSLDLSCAEDAARALSACSPIFAGTVGLDGRPRIGTAELACAEGGALYFLTLKCEMFYAELCKTPYIQLLVRRGGETLRISGKVCFTQDADILVRCIKARPDMLEGAAGNRDMLIAFFLLGAEAELETGGEKREFIIPDPEGVLIGVTIKKKNELRDRLSSILERREAEPPEEYGGAEKLLDGALFVFAEAAKALWPRMDIRPIERAAMFGTWDEREKYTALAARLIGNAVISSPEDMTYWLSEETLAELAERKGLSL